MEADRVQAPTLEPGGGDSDGGGEGSSSSTDGSSSSNGSGHSGRSGEGSRGEGGSAAAGEKRDPRDFALWKATTPEQAAVAASEGRAWASPWGVGRPGWHIECSAVTHAHFGPTLQMHSGKTATRKMHHSGAATATLHFFQQKR